ncbi:uncharacterized protein LOC111519701 [Drosophila willistoni]|uniref:uncharacterized protein LOC111519701 n=1 Tax=Drosophila willistoni TaxID=7260 RepID=UPI001F0776E8|nr:uncharacterized protein LOC111519701 [Drosophila willistoni]
MCSVHIFGSLAILLLLGNGGESESPNHSDYYFGNASMKLIRFRDFEPRQQSEQQLVREEREGRGFHFHASGQDVSVELEFIVPFFRVPVKRSMNFARNAFQSILNLRTGAIINTAVIVAAGAIIAAVVRLILAPLVITSLNNGGYILKSDKTIKRGMRGLTDAVESQLEEHNIDMTACMQRYICHYMQSSSSSTPVRLIHVLANSQWLNVYLNGTAVYNAIKVAQGNLNCDYIYRSCRWSSMAIHTMKERSWLKSLWPHFLQYSNG